jgi:hypothetical protein
VELSLILLVGPQRVLDLHSLQRLYCDHAEYR